MGERFEERFAAALQGAARAWRFAIDRELKDLGLSLSSSGALRAVAEAAEPLSQSELADRFAIEGASLVSSSTAWSTLDWWLANRLPETAASNA